MQIDNLRASTINTYNSCQWDYYLRYVLSLSTPSGKKADLGSCCHRAWELLAKLKKTGHYLLNDKYCNPEYLIEITWNKFYKQLNDLHNFTEEDKDFCYKSFYKIYNSSLNPLKLNILDIEKQFEIEIDRPGFYYNYDQKEAGILKLRGTVDLVTEIDKDTLWIQDYKTGKRTDYITGKFKDETNLHLDTQLRVYNLALSKIYPHKHRMFTMIYVNDGGPFTITFDGDDLENTIELLRKKFQEIKNNNNPVRLKDNNDRKNEFWKCRYVCHFGKTYDENGQSLCDKYYKIYRNAGLVQAGETIVELTSQGAKLDVSPRNDYSDARAKIWKGTIT